MYEIQEIVIRGKAFPAVFNVVAFKEVAARYGGITELAEKLIEDYGKAIDEFSWVIALLIKQGTDLKNFEEGTKDQAPTQEQIELILTPGKLIELQNYVMDIINAGMSILNGDNKNLDDEVDEVLEEILAVKNGEGAGGT